MFLPNGSEYNIRLPESDTDGDQCTYCVVASRDRSLHAALTSSIIYIFLSYPHLLLCSLKCTVSDVEERGEYRLLTWNHDSSALCVTTSKNFLLIYRVELSTDKHCYDPRETWTESLHQISSYSLNKSKWPRVKVSLAVVARLESLATCVIPLHDDVFLCVDDGWMYRITWDGVVEEQYSSNIRNICFSADQLQSKPEYIQTPSAYIVDVVYAPLIGGFGVVLADGRAALLTSPSTKLNPKDLRGIWAPQLCDALCCATNHKYRLIVFGCRNNDIVAYHLDHINGSLVCAYRVSPHIRDGPELLHGLCGVSHIECFSQGSAFAAVWKTNLSDEPVAPASAIFTTFGTQLWCSLESISDREARSRNCYHWVEWGSEGHSLWFAGVGGLSVMPLARSICTINAISEYMVMFSSDRIYLSPEKEKEQLASAPQSVWRTFAVPYDYISQNRPLRLVAIDDRSDRFIAAAGSNGFTYCNTAKRKWKIFGNESQEREMTVTGGMIIWEGFITVACHETLRYKEEIRFYPTDQQLDNQFCTKYEVESRVLVLSSSRNNIVTLDMESRIFIYSLSVKMQPKTKQARIVVERCAEICVSDLLPHPFCMVSVQLASLSHERDVSMFCGSIDTILINVCGRLIMLNPLKKESTSIGEHEDEENMSHLGPPILIASYVEKVWLAREFNVIPCVKPHLTQALWLDCGSKGLKVWLPLFLDSTASGVVGTSDSNRSFINKRIMLPFELDIHPLVICGEDCLARGVESTPSFPGDKMASTASISALPLYSLHRNSEVFLHHLLRQLLKRNLGLYALEIAATCTNLPYFGHVLELLLHNVLEEEASSAEPIPDPLLPRVVAFIREFPNFAQTVAHCARKTELSLWHALFAVTNSPKELFEMCIRDEQLETSASYLIILQNMESSIASREHAAVLLEEALMKRKLYLARDIVRFLSAIHPSDIDSPAKTYVHQRLHLSVGSATRSAALASGTVDGTDPFLFENYASFHAKSRTRLSNSNDREKKSSREESSHTSARKVCQTSSTDSQIFLCTSGPMHSHLQDILARHASHLLEDCSLRDLGAFAAYLNFDIVAWLSNFQPQAKTISDFGLALMRLHVQFKWPYPFISQDVVDKLRQNIDAVQCSQSCSSFASLSSSIMSKAVAPTSEMNFFDVEKSVLGSSHIVEVSEDSKSVIALNSVLSDTYSNITITNMSCEWEGLGKDCGEMTGRGSQESELELKYMLDVMYTAACIEWTFLLCVLRRDFAFFKRYFNVQFVLQGGPDSLKRLKSGIEQLKDWSFNSCFGYGTIICAFDQHLQTLERNVSWEKSHTISFTTNKHEREGLEALFDSLAVNGVVLPQHSPSQEITAGKVNGNLDHVFSRTLCKNSEASALVSQAFESVVGVENDAECDRANVANKHIISHFSMNERTQCLLM